MTHPDFHLQKGSKTDCELLLSHGYCLGEDEHEREIMMPYPPLGLLYLSSHLKAEGFSVEIHDSTFASAADFDDRLERLHPTVVGLYVTLMTRRRVLEMIAQCRDRGIRVVLGGPEPTPNAAEYLARGADVVVVGEGELTLAELLRHLPEHGLEGLETIHGLRFLDENGQLVETPPRAQITDISVQPWPDREGIDLEQYLRVWREHHGRSSISLLSSRGCPYSCRWCSREVFGRSHRRRLAQDVAEEVAELVARYQPDQLWYTDDVFTLNRGWIRDFALELRNRSLHIPFECISRADCIDESVVEALAGMGCRRLWIGSESGSQRILDRMGRRSKVEDIREKTALLHARGIDVGMFIMLGYEGETEADLETTLEHLKLSAPDIFLTTVAYPIRGTDYYREVEDHIRVDRPWEEISDRDLRIVGRHSPRYYRHVTRWMVNEVKAHRARAEGRILRGIGAWLKARVGRLGMLLSRGEREEELGAASGRAWASSEVSARQAQP